MDKQTIQQARQASLTEYLLQRGEPLLRDGRNRYKHAKHDSLIFTDNGYYWNSKGENGNSIDFLMSFFGMNFETAVKDLLAEYEKKNIDRPPKVLFTANIDFCSDMRRAIAYLTITRKISPNIIQELIQDKLIFQENHTNNIVFPVYDQEKKFVGAELCGSLSERKFKGIKEGSKYGYGYNVGFPTDGIYSYALFFESAIDLISFIEISRLSNKTLHGCLLVSMGGLKQNIIEHTLKAFERSKTALQSVVCVDNDLAGQTLCRTLTVQNRAFKTHFPLFGKDWNEQLCILKSEN